MSSQQESRAIQDVLVERLRAIPDGQITAVSKRSGVALTAILRLRRGENTDVKVSTLEKLARGLGVTPSDLIAAADLELPAVQQTRGVDPRLVRTLIRQSRVFVLGVEKVARALLAEAESEAPAQPEQATPGRRRKK